MKSLSRVRLFATLWTVAPQAPPSLGFSRQEYWSGLPFPSPGDLPDPGILSALFCLSWFLFPHSPESLRPQDTVASIWRQQYGVSHQTDLDLTYVSHICLEKEMATHSSILAWRIPWMEEPGGLQSTGSQRVGHD